VGKESVRGVRTTHFRFEVDPRRAAEAEGQEAALPQLEAAGVDTLPLDVWIDDDDLPRRIRMALGAAGADIEIDIEFFDYGEPISVEAPPEGSVRHVESLEEAQKLSTG
jgi:hypothetical protein